MIRSPILLPVSLSLVGTGLRCGHRGHRNRVPRLFGALSPQDIPSLHLRKLLTRGQIIPVQGHISQSIITTIMMVGPPILSPSFLELVWRIVQSFWCLGELWRRRLHHLRSPSSPNGPVASSLISSCLLSGFSQCQGLELSFDSHISPLDIWTEMFNTGSNFFFG